MSQPESNMERERRILDSTVELITRFGYDKTTVSDIAREAGISKGAIYLHFSSKDELFEALLLREMQRYAEDWLDRIDKAPDGGSIAALYKNSLYAMNSSPFMSAMFRQDKLIFGNYIRKPNNFFSRFRAAQAESERLVFVRMMQSEGAIRRDIDATVIAHVMDILAYGLVGMQDLLPAATTPPLDALIEGIALMMESALTPSGGGNPDAARQIVRQLANEARQQLAAMKSLSSDNGASQE